MSGYQDQPASDQSTGPSTFTPADLPPEALAGFWRRFGAALLDGILLSIVATVIVALLGLETATTQPGPRLLRFRFPPNNGVLTLVTLAYFTYFHGTAAGQSIGNRVLGIRLIDEASGGSLTYVRAFIRALMSYVSAFPFMLGYVWMLWDDRNQTWHDKVANCLVVRTTGPGASAGPAEAGPR